MRSIGTQSNTFLSSHALLWILWRRATHVCPRARAVPLVSASVILLFHDLECRLVAGFCLVRRCGLKIFVKKKMKTIAAGK